MRRSPALGLAVLGLTTVALALLPACGGNSNNGNNGSRIGYRRQSVSPIGLGLKNLMVLYVPAGMPTPSGTQTIASGGASTTYYAAFALGSGETATTASSTQTPAPDETAAGSLYLYSKDASCTNCAFNITLGLTYLQGSQSQSVIAAYGPSSSDAPPAPNNQYSTEAVYLGSGVDYRWSGNPASPPSPINASTGYFYVFMQCPSTPSCGPTQGKKKGQ